MRERNKMPTLEQVRTLFPFDVPTLALQAGVPTDIFYYALLLRPISKKDAENILRAVSQHIGLELSFHNVDIVTWEEFLVLWLIRASKNEPSNEREEIEDHFTFVYARDREHAAFLVRHWFEQVSDFPHHFFTACIDGLQVGSIAVPGHLHVDEEVKGA